jgi:hypothetical protein
MWALLATAIGWLISHEVNPPTPEPDEKPRLKGRNFRFTVRWILISGAIFGVLALTLGRLIKPR